MEEIGFILAGWGPTTLYLVGLTLVVAVLIPLIPPREEDELPTASPAPLPLLGHALAFKQDPAAFVTSQKHSICRINLAGRRMILILADAKARHQVETLLPESVVSSRQAISDMGFEYTLGRLNNFEGTDWHKRVLKDGIDLKRFPSNFYQSVKRSIYRELSALSDDSSSSPSDSSFDDIFELSRRLMLRATFDLLVSPRILENDDDEQLLRGLMEVQDKIEDATAKAAVLPRALSLPLYLWPSRTCRERLQVQLAERLYDREETDKDVVGPWLRAFRQAKLQPIEATELSIGLQFAAHKNVSIGTAQAFCLLYSEAGSDELKQAKQEAQRLVQRYEDGMGDDSEDDQCSMLQACLLETMRVSAHTIGGLRAVQRDFQLQSDSGRVYQIRKGELVAISHLVPNMDSRVFGKDAASFRVSRWSDDNSKLKKLTTFSGGLHRCPGEQLAYKKMKVLLATWLAMGLEPVKFPLPSICFERATLAQRKGPVPVEIVA